MTTEPRPIIIGAGPAGLTAAQQLLDRTGERPLVVEATGAVGGISRTVEYQGNRIDIGGHRFFSKSDRVMQWWRRVLPVQGAPSRDDRVLGRPVDLEPGGPDPDQVDEVMLVRQRMSRIYFLRSFFPYPISLSAATIRRLGLVRTTRMGLSYLWACVPPARPERNLEDFFVNRFGFELYATFFRDYTEKVWGVPCSHIDPEWGAQRVKGLSVARALWHALRKLVPGGGGMAQKSTETSLIERFYYPKLGPGQLWEVVARRVVEQGAELRMHTRVVGLRFADATGGGRRITAVTLEDLTGTRETVPCSWVFSSMPVVDLLEALQPAPATAPVPAEVLEVARGLVYRDFITVGLVLKELRGGPLPDTWIYVQERDVRMGRIQVFNNWSPYLVADPTTTWLGLEYFCTEGDDLWSRDDGDIAAFAADELAAMNLADRAAVLDSVVIRSPKTYPCYFGTYGRFDVIRRWTDGVANLFLVGRNGMHRYNNADHSMLTAMEAVDAIADGTVDRERIWSVNAEQDYHEEKSG